MPAYTITSPPAVEPVSLDEAKLWLKQDVDDDDDLISGLITAAREMCETFTNRAFITQTWQMYMDAFPGYIDRRSGAAQSVRTMSTGAWQLIGGRWGFILPASPVQSVTALTYNDQYGNPQTLATSTYNTDLVSSPARIFPVFATFWPLTQYAPNSVSCTFVCGFGDTPADVPESIKTAMKMQISWLYNNRDAQVVTTGVIRENSAVAALLTQFRDLRY